METNTFATFINDYSKSCHLYLIKARVKVFKKSRIYKNKVENQLGKNIKILRFDKEEECTIT